MVTPFIEFIQFDGDFSETTQKSMKKRNMFSKYVFNCCVSCDIETYIHIYVSMLTRKDSLLAYQTYIHLPSKINCRNASVSFKINMFLRELNSYYRV